MSAEIIRPRAFQRGPAIRAIDPAGEALAMLRLAELKTGVEASEATADALQKLELAVDELVRQAMGRPL